MAKKYIFVRMPEDIYKIYKGIKFKMEGDIKDVTGRHIPLTMPKVFKAVASPKLNKNYIELNIHDLVSLAKEKRRR